MDEQVQSTAARALRILRERGRATGTFTDQRGRVCLTQAVRLAAMEVTGTRPGLYVEGQYPVLLGRVYTSLREVIAEQYPGQWIPPSNSVGSWLDLAWWNDCRADDPAVEKVLEKVAAG